jgi:hypothetical protein
MGGEWLADWLPTRLLMLASRSGRSGREIGRGEGGAWVGGVSCAYRSRQCRLD